MLFIHDHTFIVDEENYYTTGSLNQTIMDRYIKWFGNVSVFATMREKKSDDDFNVQKKNLVKNIDFHLVSKRKRLKYFFRNLSKIKSLVKDEDCIVIRMSLFGLIGAFYAKKYKKPYLIEMVASPWDSLWYHSLKGKIIAPIMTLLTKYFCKKAPYVLYVTNEFLQHGYPTLGKSVGCSDVEIREINTSVLTNRLNRIENYNKKRSMKIVTVANVGVKYKGQSVVIQALKDLRKHGILCEYFLIGGGDKSRLKKIAEKYKVQNYVHFLGSRPHDEIFHLLDSMDLYIQPSFQEGLPRAVIEAMSRACPVVGSSAGGIPELIDSSFVFKKGSSKELIRIIKRQHEESLKLAATVNFNKAKDFEYQKVSVTRDEFYTRFASSFVESSKKKRG